MPIAAASVLALAACGDPFPDRTASRSPATASPAVAGPAVSFDPPASAGGAARLTRVRLHFQKPLAPTKVALLQGTITTTQLRDLSSGTMSDALGKRVAQSVAWIDADDPTLLSVAPLSALTGGSIYTVAVADPASRVEFPVDPGDQKPVLRRVWPPGDDAEASPCLAVWCRGAPSEFPDFTSFEKPLALEPWGRNGRLAGASALPACLVWVADDADARVTDVRFALPPPRVTAAGIEFAVDPTPIAGSGTAPRVEALVCSPAEIEFGPGCAEVLDDRLIVRPPADRVLWAIDAGLSPVVRVSGGGGRFVVRLAGETDPAAVTATVIDRTAAISTAALRVPRAAPRSHVVINEVYANPVGPEPAEEWVELFNDGSSDVGLGGYAISDGGAAAVLPDTILPAGAYALVVNESFVTDDGVDPPPAPNTAIVRVGALGKDGLSNEGEALVLRDSGGVSVSRFPAIKPKSGVSVVRTSPDALDECPESFSLDPGGSATPGARN
jgi:hypothetical protein